MDVRKWIPVLLSASACANAAIKTIEGPGGKIAYGAVDGQSAESGAMGAILKSFHNQYGDRPQVGTLFQVRVTQSVAAFFAVNKRTQGGGQLAGMIIVTKVGEDRVEAGVI